MKLTKGSSLCLCVSLLIYNVGLTQGLLSPLFLNGSALLARHCTTWLLMLKDPRVNWLVLRVSPCFFFLFLFASKRGCHSFVKSKHFSEPLLPFVAPSRVFSDFIDMASLQTVGTRVSAENSAIKTHETEMTVGRCVGRGGGKYLVSSIRNTA